MTRPPRFTAKILCAILWILVLSSVLAAQVSPSGKSSVSDKKVSDAIAKWESANKGFVQIDSEAAGKIASGVLHAAHENQPIDWSAGLSVGAKSVEGESADKRLDLLVSSYMSELRDRKYEQMRLRPGSNIELRTADVQAFSFVTYLRESQDVLRDPGSLSVISFPPGAVIKIDNGTRGFTDKDFVLSKGKHSVPVKSDKLACADSVDVEDDPVVYNCPKLGAESVPPAAPKKAAASTSYLASDIAKK